MITSGRVQAYHRDKQYSAIVGNFQNANFNTIGRFNFLDTDSVYKHLAKYTRKKTEEFFQLKDQKFDNAVEEFKKIYNAYATISQSPEFQEIVNSLSFGYELDRAIGDALTLDTLSTKLAELDRAFISLQTVSKKVNNTVHNLQNLVKNDQYFKDILQESADEKKAKKEAQIAEGKTIRPFNFKNHILNSYFGHAIRMVGLSTEALGVKAVDVYINQNIENLKIKISKATMVGNKLTQKTIISQGEKKIINYTSKGDISFEVAFGKKSAKVVFGSVKFTKGKSKEFVAVKGTSLAAVPSNEKFKADFTNLLLSINTKSDKELKFLTSLIIDYALIGVYNRPIYFLKLTPTSAEVKFFYEMYEQYSESGSGNKPYIKRANLSGGYVYKKGNSVHEQPGGTDFERGQNFYKNVRYTGGRLEDWTQGRGYMTEEYALQRSDILNMVVIGKFI